MGILNATPDSFFEGSRVAGRRAIARRVRQIVAEGGAVIDIGGYSSRPGAADISPEEELARVDRAFGVALETLRGMGSEVPEAIKLSVDTFRSSVVVALFRKYAHPFTVNDISAGLLDPQMLGTVGRLGLPYIMMHMRGTPQTMVSLTDYPGGVTEAVMAHFEERIAAAHAAGICEITLDPGFGFAKTTGQNFELLGRLGEFGHFGLPVLAGLSRKGMVWRTLGVTPSSDEALYGTCALNYEALRGGVSILRVHDVAAAAAVAAMFRAVGR